jgi:DNA repair exonuclease SbcCD ATPase subunit
MGKGNGQGDRLSGLTSSAAGLDGELRRYVELAATAVRVPLTSEKNIERAARAIADAAESEKRVLAHVQALVGAITGAREAQQSSTEALNAHASAVTRRRAELDARLARFAQLGEVAKTMNAAIQKVAGYKANPYDANPTEADEMKNALTQVEEGMATVATHANELAAEATQASFEDLARQAESLRQQVLAAKNRLSLLQKTMPGAGGSA